MGVRSFVLFAAVYFLLLSEYMMFHGGALFQTQDIELPVAVSEKPSAEPSAEKFERSKSVDAAEKFVVRLWFFVFAKVFSGTFLLSMFLFNYANYF